MHENVNSAEITMFTVYTGCTDLHRFVEFLREVVGPVHDAFHYKEKTGNSRYHLCLFVCLFVVVV